MNLKKKATQYYIGLYGVSKEDVIESFATTFVSMIYPAAAGTMSDANFLWNIIRTDWKKFPVRVNP
jgi:hypothetical protein